MGAWRGTLPRGTRRCTRVSGRTFTHGARNAAQTDATGSAAPRESQFLPKLIEALQDTLSERHNRLRKIVMTAGVPHYTFRRRWG